MTFFLFKNMIVVQDWAQIFEIKCFNLGISSLGNRSQRWKEPKAFSNYSSLPLRPNPFYE